MPTPATVPPWHGAGQGKGVAKQTHQKHTRSWNIWMEFLHRIDYSFDPYLEVLSATDRLRFCGAFMHAVWRGDFGRKGFMGGTARTAVDNVAAYFGESNRVSPIINFNGKVHVHIDCQTKGFKKEDPSTKHQNSLLMVVFKNILDMVFLPGELDCAWLVCVSPIVTIRSCKYSVVVTGERKIRAVRACNVTF